MVKDCNEHRMLLQHKEISTSSNVLQPQKQDSATRKKKDSDGLNLRPHKPKLPLLTPAPFIYLQLLMAQYWGLFCCSILRTT